jgi:hypothetical protein
MMGRRSEGLECNQSVVDGQGNAVAISEGSTDGGW